MSYLHELQSNSVLSSNALSLSLPLIIIMLRFFLEEPPGVQKLYLDKTTPPIKVSYLSDKEQKDWEKDVQGLTEQ